MTALRDEADFVITNPPFSLFREFMAWLVEGGKKFSVIGNKNAITYNEVFPLIKSNELWKGATANSTDMVFGVPKGAHGEPTPIGSRPRSSAIRQTTNVTTRGSGTRAGSPTSTTGDVTNRCS